MKNLSELKGHPQEEREWLAHPLIGVKFPGENQPVEETTAQSIQGEEDEKKPNDKLLRIQKELQEIESGLPPLEKKVLALWRNDVWDRITKGKVDEAEQELEKLKDAIPNAKGRAEKLAGVLRELQKIESTLAQKPELLEELDQWRQAVRKQDDEDAAEEELKKLKDEISAATARVERTKKLGGSELADEEGHSILELDDDLLKDFELDEENVKKLGAAADDKVKDFRVAYEKVFSADHKPQSGFSEMEADGCVISCSKPIVTLKNPVLVMEKHSHQSGKGFAGGLFGVYVKITLTPSEGSDANGWKACILQRCSANRSVSYDGRSWGVKFDMTADILPIECELIANKSATLCLTDAPKWQWDDEKVDEKDVPRKIDGVRIYDEFEVYLLIWKDPSDRKCLFEIDWEFSSDEDTAYYSIKSSQAMNGGSVKSNILSTSPVANELGKKGKWL